MNGDDDDEKGTNGDIVAYNIPYLVQGPAKMEAISAQVLKDLHQGGKCHWIEAWHGQFDVAKMSGAFMHHATRVTCMRKAVNVTQGKVIQATVLRIIFTIKGMGIAYPLSG